MQRAVTRNLYSLLTNFSPAILKYIINKYKLPDHWYPSDIRRQAKVDEYLSWHAFNLRRGAGIMLAVKVRAI